MDMLVLIENVNDGRYMGVASHWGPRNNAYDFRTPAFAIDFCVMHRLRNVRIIVDLGDPAHSIVLVVQGAGGVGLQEPETQELPQAQRALKTASDGKPSKKRDGEAVFDPA
jgi:hypothetical protein